MQDIHSIAVGGGGSLFGGGGSGDRRLRPHHHHQGHGNQALKCPRCESLNTKFCYYNNYNLSQPRHFCKSCRRYWTKGGVLRNVPVGGGCRKTKRSRPKSNSNNNPSSHSANQRKSTNSQNSSSDSSSLTATTTAANTTVTTTPIAATEVLSGSNSTNSPANLINFPDSSRRFFNITPNPSFDPPMLDQSTSDKIFPEIGTFSGLMMPSSTAPSPSLLGFNTMADISSIRFAENPNPNPNQNQQQWMQEMGSIGFMDPTAQIEFPGLQNKITDDGLAAEDWQDGAFDLTGGVDQAYWSQSQWNDDHQLNYLP